MISWLTYFILQHVIGKLYIIGGQIDGRATDQVEVLNVPSQPGEIKALSPMLEARTLHAAADAGPFVFAFGGWNGQHEQLSSCEVYDSRTNM